MTKSEIQATKVSLIMSTYNRPDALEVILNSLRNQTIMPFEIVIGDDGSTDETRDTITRIQKTFPVPIIHLWQEDKGFRAAKARNLAIANTKGDYIVEIDGDVFLSKYFIEDHLRLAKKGCYVKGGRVNLNKKLSEKICANRTPPKINYFTKGIESKRENSLRILPLALYLATRYRKNKSIGLGCNTSFWKADAIAINGYDENYEGWGCEDYDFASRLVNSGLKKLYLKFNGIVFHLWHEDKYMYNLENNQKYEQEQIENGTIYCTNGLDKYLNK